MPRASSTATFLASADAAAPEPAAPVEEPDADGEPCDAPLEALALAVGLAALDDALLALEDAPLAPVAATLAADEALALPAADELSEGSLCEEPLVAMACTPWEELELAAETPPVCFGENTPSAIATTSPTTTTARATTTPMSTLFVLLAAGAAFICGCWLCGRGGCGAPA